MPLCYRLALLLLVTTVWSCEVESLDDPIIVPVVDQEFNFQLWQNLSSTGSSPLEIRMSTVEDYDCMNVAILSNYTRVGNRLELTLFDILDPEACLAGSGPAYGIEAIDDIEESSYDLRIELQGVVSNVGTLMATNEAFTVAMQDENGISWLQYEMRRIPENAVWGYIGYADATGLALAEDFLAELAAAGSASTLADGYYGYYTLKEDGSTIEINQTGLPPADQNMTFISQFDGSAGELEQLILDFLADADPQFRLMVRDGKGNAWQR